MDKKDILTLASLSRLEITDAEAEAYKKDFDGILNYVDSIASVDISNSKHYETNVIKNIMRSDDDVYKAGLFTDDILKEAPNSKDGYFKVKKVL